MIYLIITVLVVAAFIAGGTLGTREGYHKAMEDTVKIIERMERLYRDK